MKHSALFILLSALFAHSSVMATETNIAPQFWGIEAYMERIYGVKDAVSGYANGHTDKTSYPLVGKTDHAETVKVTYDANQISLDKLLQYYFKVIDPTSLNQQGNDRGRQYRTGIYYQDVADKSVIEQALNQLQSKYKS